MNAAFDFHREMLMTEVVSLDIGADATKYALKVRVGFNWSTHRIMEPYDTRVLQAEPRGQVPRIVELMNSAPISAMIGGASYKLAAHPQSP